MRGRRPSRSINRYKLDHQWLVNYVAVETGMDDIIVGRIIAIIIDEMSWSLSQGHDVSLRSFGRLSVRTYGTGKGVAVTLFKRGREIIEWSVRKRRE
jgi:nucleoid DNA-binding protein